MNVLTQPWNHRSWISAMVLLVLATVASCTGTASMPARSCELGCDDAQLCWYSRGQCVPAPQSGTCPHGYVYNECATGSCPLCRDCVPACLPEDALP